MKKSLEAIEFLDSPNVSGANVAALLNAHGLDRVDVTRIDGEHTHTDVVKIVVPGTDETMAPLGIIGMLGGVGARPASIGIVSDADGAVVALGTALKLADMAAKGDRLARTVIITTHICPNSPTRPHEPVPFMSSPVDRDTLLDALVMPEMGAILSVDTSRGNRYVNHNGIAITPTVLNGYILRVSEYLIDLLEYTTGESPFVLPITTQDITPYANGLYHINSIMQPVTISEVPLVGIAVCSARTVPGCATGATQCTSVEVAVRLCIETAKLPGAIEDVFFDREEFGKITAFYGDMSHLKAVPA